MSSITSIDSSISDQQPTAEGINKPQEISLGTKAWKLPKVQGPFRQLPYLECSRRISRLVFSPDGRFLASISDGIIHLWERQGRLISEEPRVLGERENPAFDIAFSSNGRYLVLGGYDRTVRLWKIKRERVAAGKDPCILFTGQKPIAHLAFSAKGYLVFVDEDSKLYWGKIFKRGVLIQEKKEFQVLSDWGDTFQHVISSPDGRYLATSGSDHAINIWSVKKILSQKIVLPVPGAHVTALAFTKAADGYDVVAGASAEPNPQARNDLIYLWKIFDKQGMCRANFIKQIETMQLIDKLVFLSEGSYLASTDGNVISLWKKDGSSLKNFFTREFYSDEEITDMAFSFDGHYLAVGSKEGTLSLWEFGNGNFAGEKKTLLYHHGEIEEFSEKAEYSLEKKLNYAVLLGLYRSVKTLLKNEAVPSKLTMHLAAYTGNSAVLKYLDEVAPFLREKELHFQKEGFEQFLKCLSKCHGGDGKGLILDKHPEINDTYFSFHRSISLSWLQRLDLFGCVAITDEGLESIAQRCLNLQTINLGVEKHYEDLGVLALGVLAYESKDPFLSRLGPYRLARAYENYKKRQRSITKRGLLSIARNCQKMQDIALAYCHGLSTEEIAEVFANPEYFPQLEELDLSDCYQISTTVIKKIEQVHRRAEIKQDRIFSSKSIPQLLCSVIEKTGIPMSPGTFSKLQEALKIVDSSERTRTCLEILGEDQGVSLDKDKEDNNRDFTSVDIDKQTVLSQSSSVQEARGSVCSEELKEIAKQIACDYDYWVLYALLKKGVTLDASIFNEVFHKGVSREKYLDFLITIRLILDAGVLLTKEVFAQAIKQEGEEMIRLLLDYTVFLPDGILDLAVKYRHNDLITIQKILEKKSHPTQNTLLLAVKHNHFRIVRALLETDIYPTEEVLNKAAVHGTPAVVKLILKRGIFPTQETWGLVEKRKNDDVAEKDEVPKLLKTRVDSRDTEIRSLPEEHRIILQGTYEQVQKRLENSLSITKELIDEAIERNSSTVLQMLLEKKKLQDPLDKKEPQIAEDSYAFACFKGFDEGVRLFQEYAPLLAEIQKETYLTDEMFKRLVEYWSDKRSLILQGCFRLTDACFDKGLNLHEKLPHIKQVNLLDCSKLSNRSLASLSWHFPNLEILAVGSPQESDIKVENSIEALTSIQKCQNLQVLFLKGWQSLSEPAIQILADSTAFRNLKQLTFFDCAPISKDSLNGISKEHPSLKISILHSPKKVLVNPVESSNVNTSNVSPPEKADTGEHIDVSEWCFGEKQWRDYFGDIGGVPPCPSDILNAPCPIWEGKKIKETHLLTLIPHSVNERPLTLDYLGELVKEPRSQGMRPGHKTKYRYYDKDVQAKYGNIPIECSYWVLMTKDVLPNTRHKTYKAQLLELQNRAQDISLQSRYETPRVLEAAVCILMEYVRNERRLYSDKPWTYTFCQETIGQHNSRVIIGNFSSVGLGIHYSDDVRERNGLALIRRF